MAKHSYSENPSYLIIIGLLVSGLLISVPAMLSLRASRQLADSFHWVNHTLEVEHQTQRLLSLLIDAETGYRGFLLSNRDNYLEPYRSALKRIPGQKAVLRDLTSDNPLQQENLLKLDPLISAKLRLMADAIALKQAGKSEEAQSLLLTDHGKEVMDGIRARLELMDQEEARLLASRQESLTANFNTNSSLLFGLTALNGIFAGGILILFYRLQHVKNLVTICAWSHTVQYEGKWISIEEYLHRRFNIDLTHGISPAEFEKAMANLEDPAEIAKEIAKS